MGTPLTKPTHRAGLKNAQPQESNGESERIEPKTLASQASSQLGEKGAGVRVVRQIARRAWLTGARVLAVRDSDIPGHGPVAATLR